MSLPKRRISRARGRKRRAANMRLAVPTLVECGNCGNRIMPHRVCPKCGYYAEKPIVSPEGES